MYLILGLGLNFNIEEAKPMPSDSCCVSGGIG
jgi:hypothetical protein